MPKLSDSLRALERLVERVTENASGESSASLEAINRVAAEKQAGMSRYRIDPDGNATPLTGVDAVDAKAPPGHIHTIVDAGGNPTITDRDGLPASHANGLLQRALDLSRIGDPVSASFESIKPGEQLGPVKVGSTIANRSSVEASLGGTDYTIEPGIQKVPLSAFYEGKPAPRSYSATENARTAALADEIRQNGYMDPLIVGMDEKGPYVIEGGHRLDAAYQVGMTHIPAMVVREAGVPSIPSPAAPAYAGGGSVSPLETFADGISAAVHRSSMPFGTGYESAYNTGRNVLDNPTADATRRVQGTAGRSDFDALAQRFLPKSPLQPVTAGGMPMPGFAGGGAVEDTLKYLRRFFGYGEEIPGGPHFHGTASPHIDVKPEQTDPLWFAPDEHTADMYRTRSLIQNADRLELPDDVSSVDELGHLDPDLMREYGLDPHAGTVVGGQLRARKIFDVDQEFGDTLSGGNVSDLKGAWAHLNRLGIVNEPWKSFDPEIRQELKEDFGGKGAWKFMEENNVYPWLQQNGYDAVKLTDVDPSGNAHLSYGLLKPFVHPLEEEGQQRLPGFADGGAVEATPEEQAQFNSTSSMRKLADLARRLDNPKGDDPHAENRARLASNVASLLYGLDAHGNPVFGGRAWTSTQGGTPMGALDAITAIPHGVVGLGRLLDQYAPGKPNPQFWDSIDPQWSRDAQSRLEQLHKKVQQTSGVGAPKDLTSTILDMASDPQTMAVLAGGRLAAPADTSALRRLINASLWGSGDSNAVAAQGR